MEYLRGKLLRPSISHVVYFNIALIAFKIIIMPLLPRGFFLTIRSIN